MKSKPEQDLGQLVGRTVSVFWNGSRTGVVKAVRGQMLTVQLLPPNGRHRIALEALEGVHWFGRRRSLAEFLELRARAQQRSQVAP